MGNERGLSYNTYESIPDQVEEYTRVNKAAETIALRRANEAGLSAEQYEKYQSILSEYDKNPNSVKYPGNIEEYARNLNK